MKSIQLDFYDEFYCLAADCRMTCCMDWKVMFSEEEYHSIGKYYGDRLQKEGDAWRLSFGNDGYCTFLNEKGLCKIVLAHGEEALCATGRNYPRQIVVNNDTQEFHLSNGCEAVLRFFLHRENALCFAEVDKPLHRNAVPIDLSEYMVGITQNAITLMQLRDIPLWIRLIILRKYVASSIKEGAAVAWEGFQTVDDIARLAFVLKNVSFQSEQQIMMMRTILPEFLSFIKNKCAYRIAAGQCDGALKWLQEEDVAEIRQAYDHFVDELTEYEVFFEHMCVNYLFTHTGYMYDAANAIFCVDALLLQIALIRMLLFCKWHFDEQSFGDRDVILITALFARMIEHGMDAVTGFLRENKDNPWFTDAGFAVMLQ